MSKDLDFPVEVVASPTVREEDGLAMSSRNAYLSEQEREAASVLFRALSSAREAFEAGERDSSELRASMDANLEGEPLARPDYTSVADPETLEELHGSVKSALLSMAVYVGETRLIDNVVVGK